MKVCHGTPRRGELGKMGVRRCRGMESQLFRPRNVVQKCYGRPWVVVMVWQMKKRRNKQTEPKAFVNCGLRQRFIRWARSLLSVGKND